MATLTFLKNKFWFIGSDSISVQETAAKAGFGYDAETFEWFTRNAVKALKLRRYADESAERKFKKLFITEFAPPEGIIHPSHLEPKPFQLESALHALTRTPAYIADEAGLGKTITSILCVNTEPGKTLIICPPFLKYNWADEVHKWTTGLSELSSSIVENINNIPTSKFQSDIMIVPDSIIARPEIQRALKKLKFKWLFIDEAHRFKSGDAQRTTALLGDDKNEGITSIAKRVVFLSGTPIPNGRPIELYPLLSSVAPQSIKHRSKEDYGKTFCAGKTVVHFEGRRCIRNWDFTGASNLKQLRSELREKFMIRHLKKNVLKDLPAKTRQIVFLDKPDTVEAFEKSLLKNYTIEQLLGADAKLGDIASYAKLVGEEKIRPALKIIKDTLENSKEKLVVFAHHVSVVDELHAGLKKYGALKVRGGMSAKAKQMMVTAFQTQKSSRVIIGNIDSMGIGNTLTRAPMVIMVEPSWVPGANSQAEDRIYRIGQTASNIYIKYLVLRGSLDERKLRIVLTKETNIDQAMGC